MRYFQLLIAACFVVAMGASSAAVITVAAGAVEPSTTVCSLIDAINAANSDTATGACPAGTSGGNTIQLAAGTYTLSLVDNYWYGPNGLPPISSTITIAGDPTNGSTIERSTATGTPAFRIFYVSAALSLANYNSNVYSALPGPGTLTLGNLTIENGFAQGGNGANGGGGGAGLGGAIYNQGTLNLDTVTLTDNEAIGGAGTATCPSNQINASGGGMGATAGSTGDGGGFDPNGLWPSSAALYSGFGNGAALDGKTGGVGGGGGGGGTGGGYGGGGGYDADGGFGGAGGGGNGTPNASNNATYGGFGGGVGAVLYASGTICYLSSGGGGAGLGGAVFNEGGAINVLNSTISGNTAQGGNGTGGVGSNFNGGGSPGDGYGGGLFNLNGSVSIRFSTLSNTVASGTNKSNLAAGAEVYSLSLTTSGSPAADQNKPAILEIESSVLASTPTGSSGTSDCENNGGSFSSAFNVVENAGSCAFSSSNHDQISVSPLLNALANNGGTTETMALQNGSPAIGAGDISDPPVTDQRGYLRNDKAPSVGAFEYGATPPPNPINNPVPILSSLSPSDIAAGGASFTLTVNGSSFVSGGTVNWNGAALQTIFVSASQFTAVVPAADIANAGSNMVAVTNPVPGGGISSSITFAVVNPIPVISSLNPSSISSGGASFALTVNGSQFISGAVVNWNSTGLTTTFVSSTQLAVTVPASDIATAGTINVTVINPSPSAGVSAASNFTINNPTPAIAGLNPSSVVVGSSTFTLTVNGSAFVSGATVNANGTALATTFVSSGELTATVPASDIVSAGPLTITVTNPTPGGGTSSGDTLTVGNPVPVITSLNPASAEPGGAAFTLAVNGTGFVKGSNVYWNGNVLVTTFVSSTELTAAVPAANIAGVGTATVTVTSPSPGGGTSDSSMFTVSANSSSSSGGSSSGGGSGSGGSSGGGGSSSGGGSSGGGGGGAFGIQLLVLLSALVFLRKRRKTSV